MSRVSLLPVLILALLVPGCSSTERVDDAIRCEILVVGGSLGGVAAALGAAGKDVWVVEESSRVGGQVTTQGVSALDEHRYIERFGGTKRYSEFRTRLRARYGGVANPGGGWVSRLCFLPKDAEAVLAEMLGPTRVLTGTRVVSAELRDDRIRRVVCRDRDGRTVSFAPTLVLEATDAGDLLAVADIEHRVGTEARSETGEPHADEVANPDRLQSFTFGFAVEHRPGERHVVPRPSGYERFRESQPYTLDHHDEKRGRLRYGFFAKLPGTPGSFFDYRRIGPQLALINWPGNDYRGTPLLAADHDEAKRLSLGFLHWLQTECPRDDGGLGYPELLLRKDVMGTEDGLSERPYVREGRRLVARSRIVEQDLVTETARARVFRDSVGVGYYGIDLHACAGDADDTTGRWIPCRPFQIPYSAMVPRRVRNLLAAGKTLGTSHVTNGAYRLHPVEWNVGESAGRLAAFCLDIGAEPPDLLDDPRLLRGAQWLLLSEGVPIFWYVDLPGDATVWKTAQFVAVASGEPADPMTLDFGPEPERAQLAARLAARILQDAELMK